MTYSEEDYLYLIDILKDIQSFGKNNPGCGYSCAKKAEVALIKVNTLLRNKEISEK